MMPDLAARRVRQFGERYPGALRLAQWLSFAAIAEPGLIRRVRLQLGPDSSASDEADLWFSPLVQSASPSGLVFFPEIADILRKSLPAPLADAAWELTRTLHVGSRRALQIEEELSYLSLDPDGHRARIDELLHQVIGAFVGGRTELANWAARALPRLPDAVRKMDSAAVLGVASDLRTGRADNLRQTLGAVGRIPSWIAAVLPSLGRVRLRVAIANRELILGPALTAAETAEPGIEVPDTPIIPVEVRWTGPNAPPPVMLFVKKDDTVRTELAMTGPIELITLADESWTVSRTEAAEVQRTIVPLALRAVTDGTAVALRWRASGPIAGCVGFTLKRRRQTSASEESTGEPEVILAPGEVPAPIQRYSFIDRPLPRGALYSYQVVAVRGTPPQFEPIENLASAWSPFVWVGPQVSDPVAVLLNRTLDTAAQLDLTPDMVAKLSLGEFERAIATPANPIRSALGGDLLASLKSLLERAAASAAIVYAALFDLGDPEILELLAKLGPRANVILSDGADREQKTEVRTANQAALTRSGVHLIPRVLGSGRLAHNKFTVVCNSSGDAETVWTGNVTWSSTALCARSNVAVLIASRELGQAYVSLWRRLAANPSTADLRAVNGNPSNAIAVGVGTVRPLFTPVADRADLRVVEELIRSARQGVLFLLSEPGKISSVMTTIASQQRLYKLGAVRNGPSLTLRRNEQEIRVSGKALAFPIFDAVASGPSPRLPFGSTLQTRLIVIDPLGSRPVVLIGSHSYGDAGSRENDENFVVIEGNAEAAQRCAAHIEMFCQHFRRRARQMQRTDPAAPPPEENWQSPWFTAPAVAETAFWMGEDSRELMPPQPNDAPVESAPAPAPADEPPGNAPAKPKKKVTPKKKVVKKKAMKKK